MSIIHDALKKVQHRLDKKHPAPAAKAVPISPVRSEERVPYGPGPTAKNAPFPRSILITLYAVLVPLAIILLLIFNLTSKPTATSNVAAAPAPAVVAAPTAPAAAIPASSPAAPVAPTPAAVQNVSAPVAAAAPRDPHALELGGTMLMGDQRVALINEDIYEVGSTVDGKKITEILQTEVKLINEKTGEVTTIKVRNRR